jgi:hypothetical protein
VGASLHLGCCCGAHRHYDATTSPPGVYKQRGGHACSLGLSASSTFLSQQTIHQQPTNSIFLSEQISTSYQPLAKRTG